MYAIRRRSTGEIVESGFAKRQEGKPKRDNLNADHYGKSPVPDNFREFYIVRSVNHPKGLSK